ncbi:MAG: pitrilysin family protein [Smithella sp.]|nr:pitrilysin family protein [Smithella sp.]
MMNMTLIKKYLILLPLVLLVVVQIAAQEAFCASTSRFAFPSPDEIQYQPLRFELPQAQRAVLSNGIVLYVLENHELPLVNVSALVRTGTMHDPDGKEGVAELTAYLMRTGGTKKTTSADIDRLFDEMAATAAISMSMESAEVTFAVLEKHFDQGLELLSNILMQPAFENNKFELARQLKIEEIRRIQDDPQRFAFREFNRLLYHEDPRGRFPSFKSLNHIKRDDLLRFHQSFFMPNNIMFAVSGDITKEQALEKFNRYFGQWKSGKTTAPFSAPSPISNAGIYVMNKAIPQSTIVGGRAAASKNSPDYYSFTLLDFIIGSGGFSSRIVSTVRSNEGLAYSAGSFYRARPEYGFFGHYAFTKTSETMRTLSLLDSVLSNLLTDPVTQNELDWAKSSINNGFIFSFATPEQIVRQQMNIEFEKLPATFLTGYRDAIDKVKLDDLNKVAQKYMNDSKAVILILGDRNNFDKPLEKYSRHIILTPEE